MSFTIVKNFLQVHMSVNNIKKGVSESFLQWLVLLKLLGTAIISISFQLYQYINLILSYVSVQVNVQY